MEKAFRIISLCLAALVTSCSYNPFSNNNHTTGHPLGVATGAAVGAGSVGLLGGSKPLMIMGGVAGGIIGYYVTTLRYDAGGVMQSGGQVYSMGQYVGIYISSDKLFEPNTAELLPQADAILDSAVDILQRNPNNNIIISGNTSGFGRAKWEQKLSEQRAAKVAAYLWNKGINQFKDKSIEADRKLNYVGYGDFFPVASTLNNHGIRQNSRIQITSYPSKADLHIDDRSLALHNIGSLNNEVGSTKPEEPRCGKGKFKDC